MAEQTSEQHSEQSAKLSVANTFHPRLGDLALDLAKGGQIGVVVALPSDNAKSYHLRLPGGGGDWRAKPDGTTLRPVSVPVTHVSPQRRDVAYDRQAQRAALPVTVHHEDGGTSESVLVLDMGQVERLHLQFTQLLERRDQGR
ncbi:hypothetical protein AB0I16_22225 [Streptomyces sp. NPDC050703]|uniref:hypothetical protein n=1 Tax=Streptomyces sp. NPDC050703 TaxID=3157218 RepID=UPI0034482E65